MSRNRLNPWPSVADLFSALSVVAFAALIVVTVGAVILTEKEKTERDAAGRLATIFTKDYRPTPGQSVRAQSCKDRETEQCIEISFRFKTGDPQLTADGVEEVRQACTIYRGAVDKLVSDMRAQRQLFGPADLTLVIEGNTDQRIPPNITEPKEHFLFNWRLSAGRAANVLYEFKKCGVSPEKGYRLVAVGLADTNKLCEEPGPDETWEKCHERNRRTTMRIRVRR